MSVVYVLQPHARSAAASDDFANRMARGVLVACYNRQFYPGVSSLTRYDAAALCEGSEPGHGPAPASACYMDDDSKEEAGIRHSGEVEGCCTAVHNDEVVLRGVRGEKAERGLCSDAATTLLLRLGLRSSSHMLP